MGLHPICFEGWGRLLPTAKSLPADVQRYWGMGNN